MAAVCQGWNRTDGQSAEDLHTLSPYFARSQFVSDRFWGSLARTCKSPPESVLICPVARRQLHRVQDSKQDVLVSLVVGYDVVAVERNKGKRKKSSLARERELEIRRSFLANISSSAATVADFVFKALLSELAASSRNRSFDFNHSMDAALFEKPSMHAERFELQVKKVLDHISSKIGSRVKSGDAEVLCRLVAADAWFIEEGDVAFHDAKGFDMMTFVTKFGQKQIVVDPESGNEVPFSVYYRTNLAELCPRLPSGKSWAAIKNWAPNWLAQEPKRPLTQKTAAMTLGDSVGVPFELLHEEQCNRGIIWFRFHGKVKKIDRAEFLDILQETMSDIDFRSSTTPKFSLCGSKRLSTQ